MAETEDLIRAQLAALFERQNPKLAAALELLARATSPQHAIAVVDELARTAGLRITHHLAWCFLAEVFPELARREREVAWAEAADPRAGDQAVRWLRETLN